LNKSLYMQLRLPSEWLNKLIQKYDIKREFHVSMMPVCYVNVVGLSVEELMLVR
jgi:hypothetical protein